MSNAGDKAALEGELSQLDRELVALVERRVQAAQRLGALRDGEGPSPRPVPPELIGRALEHARGVVPKEILAKIVSEVATACAPYLEPARIAFCDAAAAAVRLRFGENANLVQAASIEAAVAEVEAGRAVFAVVPYERAPHGVVNETLSALLHSELRVLACFDAHVYVPERSPRAAGEPGASVAPTSAPPEHEMMRYAVLGARATRRTGADRTAVVFTLADDAPGSLHAILHAFKENDINLTHIDSRLGVHPSASYLFFIETEGHVTDRAMVSAIDSARRTAKFLRVLGSFAHE